jgi:heat shock protein HslJ
MIDRFIRRFRPMLLPRPTVTALIAASFLGCASMPSAADPPALEGTAWVLAELPGQALAAGGVATLRFEGGLAQGHDGCNHYSAPYKVTGSTLEISERGVSTLMACPPDVMKPAEAFAAARAGARSYRVESNRLELLAADGRRLATLAPQPTTPAGTAWQATAINNGREAVASLVADSSVTLAFAADGTASGSAGCNRFTTGYRSEGSRLTFGPVVLTRMMCPRPEVMEQEQSFVRALESVATARFDGDRLELRTGAGAIALQLTLARQP